MPRKAVFHDSGVFDDGGAPLTVGGAVSSVFGRTGAVVAAPGDYTASDVGAQPVDSDLTAIAALSTTSFGRALLALADAAALRTAAALGTASTNNTGDFDAAGAAAAAQAASQPLDSDLTAIAALTTTSFGRAFLTLADAAATRTALSLVPGTDVEAHDSDLTAIAGLTPTNDDVIQRKAGAWTNRTMAQLIADLAALGTTFQPLDSDLTSIAALATTSFGRSLLTAADAAALRTLAGTVIGTDVQAFDAELAALAGLTSAANKVPYFTGSGSAALADFTAAGRALVDDADAAAQRTTLGLGSLATLSAISSSEITDGTIVDADVSGSAAIAYSKLALASSIVGADLSSALATSLGGLWTVVTKPSDTSRNSTTVLAADPHLVFTPVSGGIYEVELVILYVSASGGGTPDLKIGFAEDATSRGELFATSFTATDSVQNAGLLASTGSALGAGTATTNRVLLMKGTYIGTGATAGFYWAQNTSAASPNDTTVKTGSFMRYRRVI